MRIEVLYERTNGDMARDLYTTVGRLKVDLVVSLWFRESF